MFKTFLSRGCKSKKLWYYIIYICWKIIDSIELIIAIEAHKYLNRNYVIIRVLCIRERYNISVCNLHTSVQFFTYTNYVSNIIGIYIEQNILKVYVTIIQQLSIDPLFLYELRPIFFLNIISELIRRNVTYRMLERNSHRNKQQTFIGKQILIAIFNHVLFKINGKCYKLKVDIMYRFKLTVSNFFILSIYIYVVHVSSNNAVQHGNERYHENNTQRHIE